MSGHLPVNTITTIFNPILKIVDKDIDHFTTGFVCGIVDYAFVVIICGYGIFFDLFVFLSYGMLVCKIDSRNNCSIDTCN